MTSPRESPVQPPRNKKLPKIFLAGNAIRWTGMCARTCTSAQRILYRAWIMYSVGADSIDQHLGGFDQYWYTLSTCALAPLSRRVSRCMCVSSIQPFGEAWSAMPTWFINDLSASSFLSHFLPSRSLVFKRGTLTRLEGPRVTRTVVAYVATALPTCR